MLLLDVYLFFGFKGSRFQSTLNRKTKNQPAAADEKEQGIEWDEPHRHRRRRTRCWCLHC